MSNFQVKCKLLFDFLISFCALLILFPIILIAWIFASIETRSNGFFFQKRVGQNGKLFMMIKIKTMRELDGFTSTVTTSDDIRITKSGAFLRKTKIDELPQLWNIFLGQMSFVGPRPDVEGYADKLVNFDKIILSVRPGITGPAQLTYRNEELLLASQDNPVRYNDDVIWPNKVKINREYVQQYSFIKDLYYIWKTLMGCYVKY
jgi:lipopolysaccharide/colanic/teichoic acid biosynthesis glycosyltransferase